MKLSIAWIFDHIQADWKQTDIPKLVDTFNRTTAEIEHFYKVSLDLDLFTLARVISVRPDAVVVESSELKKEISLPYRDDAVEGHLFLVKKEGKAFQWATVRDWHCNKDGLLPAFYCDEQQCSGSWKKDFEVEDYIIDVDNKSITHRPDMWGHRGFAREIAAILKVPCELLEHFLVDKKIKQYDSYNAPKSEQNPFSLDVKDPEICKRFVGFYMDQVEQKPSSLWMAYRLLRVDTRAIDALVDATNYVMLDVSQPMHAFDAQKIASHNIVVRFARNKEKLTLLDGETVELTSHDCVVTDGKNPIALGGVMGGLSTAVTPTTNALFLEAACFDATTIRRTAAQFKKRTEASARFEKSLDPNQNTTAILRFLKLLDQMHVKRNDADEIVSLGKRAQEVEITITHDCIEQKLGTTVSSDFVISMLERLAFAVSFSDGLYTIFVPTFRCTKDVTIKEDIVEEVGRFFGFESIERILPSREMASFSLNAVLRKRSIKRLLAYSLSMREVYNYAFFDESFLRELQWEPKDTPTIKNPVSENWRRLVTSLIPALLKTVVINKADHDSLRFFEWGRTWTQEKKIIEQNTLAGIFFDQHATIDFYDAKAYVQRLFDLLEMSVSWKKIDAPDQPWFAPYQSAYLMCNGKTIGIAGKMSQPFLDMVAQGDAFIFEIDADFLLNYKEPVHRFIPLPKYPGIIRDISLLVPLHVIVDELVLLIKQADTYVISVDLIDFFEKEEWKDKRSVTFRFEMRDPEKTLTKKEADAVWDKIVVQLHKCGAIVR